MRFSHQHPSAEPIEETCSAKRREPRTEPTDTFVNWRRGVTKYATARINNDEVADLALCCGRKNLSQWVDASLIFSLGDGCGLGKKLHNK
ncbi:hypothetical protein AVEN_154125-1 [Araneus ventricosus]|uniref:Uncharacterized protein n=1 Tax=Araneus ventricosus TaxID=182803 RepID=A0A4Y2CVR8_ARAVE|nr:hypothetical protein AVEN_154125-1 [Araneus ventricosus]